MPDVESLIPPDVGRPSIPVDAGRPKRGRSDSSGSTNPRPHVSPCLPGPSHSSDVPDGTDIPVPEYTQEELHEIDMDDHDDLLVIDRDEQTYLFDHMCMHDHFISDSNDTSLRVIFLQHSDGLCSVLLRHKRVICLAPGYPFPRL